MAKLTILEYPDPRLRTKAAPVERVDADLGQVIDDMFETMYAAPGIGLAATQVDVHKRLVVIDVSEDKSEPLVFINPEIIERAGSLEAEEGCLSVPGIFDTPTARSTRIACAPSAATASRSSSRPTACSPICIQHELDHLDGKLFVDYLSELKRNRIRKKLEKERQAQPAPATRRAGNLTSGTASPATLMQPLRIVFAGTPEFCGAGPATRCTTRGTRSSRSTRSPTGRPGAAASSRSSPVKQRALELGLPVEQPRDAQGAGGAAALARAGARPDGRRGLRADPAAGGARPAAARLPQHPRLAAAALARRGADPARRSWPATRAPASRSCRWTPASTPGRCCCGANSTIGPRETGGELHDRLAQLGARGHRRRGAGLGSGLGRAATPQPAEGATYAAKIRKDEARIDWSQSAAEIDRQVRAFNPWPVAETRSATAQVRIWEARPVTAEVAVEPARAGYRRPGAGRPHRRRHRRRPARAADGCSFRAASRSGRATSSIPGRWAANASASDA